jgi:mono/diheme cytochrome c family protein
MSNSMRALGAAAAVAIAAFGAKAYAADAAQGQALARQWCAACHAIDERRGAAQTDAAPGFAVIARQRQSSPAELRAWLSTSHPNMPNFNLSESEIADLVAFIQGFAAR